jgi:protein ImuA
MSSPPSLRLASGVELACGRAHEACGPSRHLFALLAGARLAGPILWLHPAWEQDRLNGDGVQPVLAPGRLVFGATRTPRDTLWAAEEALRAGVVPLVVAELAAPPALTPVRRLHLAAEAGARDGAAPLMLLLTPGEGGAQGIETRWHLAPAPGWAVDGRPRWRLTRARARMAPERSWEVQLRAARMTLAAPPGPTHADPTPGPPAAATVGP